MKLKPPRVTDLDVLSTSVSHQIVKELKQKAQNNKITISKLTRSILYEYLKAHTPFFIPLSKVETRNMTGTTPLTRPR